MKIAYCLTDEASRLSSYSWLPIAGAFARACNVSIEVFDVSLASRLLAGFPSFLRPEQRQPDSLRELTALMRRPDGIVIKPPGISASLAQLRAAIAELRGLGLMLPEYPDSPADENEREVRARYEAIRGSAVNSCLRQGNSERRIPRFVKENARKNPHPLGAWSNLSRSHVASMNEGDFCSTELSATLQQHGSLRIEHVTPDGVVTLLKQGVEVRPGDVADAAVMRRESLRRFFSAEMEAAQRENVLFSLQLKATTMRVSDPAIFGCAVQTCLESTNTAGPDLACVEPRLGISTLHASGLSSIAISMASALRAGGLTMDTSGQYRDTKFVIPDSAYAGVYKVFIEECIAHGPLDPAQIGSIALVGLTAEAAEEYGSSDKTFIVEAAGRVCVTNEQGATLFEHATLPGDIWRMCLATETAITDWIQRGVEYADQEDATTVFFLDESRPHHRELVLKLRARLAAEQASKPILVLPPEEAMRFTLQAMRAGKNVVAVVGNVLRDYLTELFAVVEVGSSTSVMALTRSYGGGTLFEAGAAGCAPDHVRQFIATNHLRWSPLGESVATAAAMTLLAKRSESRLVRALAEGLGRASEQLVSAGLLPSRNVAERDTRGSHFHLARLWAIEMACAPEIGPRFEALAQRLAHAREQIERQLLEVQGQAVDLHAHYWPDSGVVRRVMCPSPLLNEALLNL